MGRALFNISMAVGYVVGLLLVWISVKAVAMDPSDVLPAFLGLIVALAWWTGLAWIGRRLSAGPSDRPPKRRVVSQAANSGRIPAIHAIPKMKMVEQVVHN